MSVTGVIWPEQNGFLAAPIAGEMHPVTAAVFALREAVLADAAAWVTAKPGRGAIEATAKAICRAMNGSPFFSVDEVVAGSVNAVPMMGPKGTVCIYHPLRPAWMLYIREAAAALGVTDV